MQRKRKVERGIGRYEEEEKGGRGQSKTNEGERRKLKKKIPFISYRSRKSKSLL